LQPKIYDVNEHQIARDQIDPHAHLVIQKLREAGHVAYLVGGGVRDLLLKKNPKDFDVSTSAKPEEVRHLFRNAILIGRRFRLAHIRFGKKVIEVSTFRSGATEEAGLIVRDNEWGSEEQDVLRRDFTINGLFYDPQTQRVIDYVDGYPDLAKRVLRTIGQPEVRFRQDPVRMIRLIKFCARFNFEIDRPTFEALLSCKGEILKSSSARIFEELLRMLESGSAKPFFHLLNEYGLLKPLSSTLAHSLNDSQLRLLAVIDDEIRKHPPNPLDRALLLATLVFPIFVDQLQDKTLHLGQISDIAHRTIDQVFLPFFKIPRRMRAVMAFLMSCQFRFIPLDGRPVRRPRVSHDPLFPLALQLLKWRSEIHPELLPHYTLWTEATFASHEAGAEPAPRRRRRRRHR
jgi:poly(A) polymerase